MTIVRHKNAHLYEGKVYNTISGDLEIIRYENSSKVQVQFLQTGYTTTVQFTSIRNGNICDRLLPSVYGVGVLGYEPTKINKVHLKEYELWSGMLERAYSTKCKEKQPAYLNCTVDERFHNYSYFKDWCNEQVGFNAKDDKGRAFALDKDVLIKGNKIYSEDVCVFVPVEINSLFTKATRNRGDLPLGVCFHKVSRKYQSRLQVGCGRRHLGVFNTPEEAFYVYKQAKEQYIKEVANKWKGRVDVRVYEALMKYEVEITD